MIVSRSKHSFSIFQNRSTSIRISQKRKYNNTKIRLNTINSELNMSKEILDAVGETLMKNKGEYFFHGGELVFYDEEQNTFLDHQGKSVQMDLDKEGNPILMDEDNVRVKFRNGRPEKAKPLIEKSMDELYEMLDVNITGKKRRDVKREDIRINEVEESKFEEYVSAVPEEEGYYDLEKYTIKTDLDKGRYYSPPSREFVDDESGETFVLTDEDIQFQLRMEKENDMKMNSDLRIDGLKYRTLKRIQQHNDPNDPFLEKYEDLIDEDVDRDVREIQMMLRELDSKNQLEPENRDGKFASLRELLDDKSTPLKLRELKYWALYPKRVREWVMFTKSTRGYYNQWGRWVPTEDLTQDKKAVDPELEEENWMKWQKVFEEEQKSLPEHLRNKYRFGIKPDEIEKCHPKIKHLFSMTHASIGEKSKSLNADYIESFKKHASDTGSSQIQVATLTLKIRNMMEHLRKHTSDKHKIRVLQKFVARRRSLMKHLKRNDVETYYRVLLELKLGDIVQLFKNNPQEKR
jgi:small subunit ribosomal protein S15